MIQSLLKSAVLSVLFLLLGSTNVFSHPWGGLVVDSQGNIYFTFIAPFVDDNHYACVWEIDEEQSLNQVLQSAFSPSDIIVSRSPSRTIFAAERSGSSGGYQARLWAIDGSNKKAIIDPTNDPSVFHIQAYAVSDDGTIFFAKDDQLFKTNKAGSVSQVALKEAFQRIDDLAWGLDNKLYILDRGSIKIVEEDSSVTILAEGLKEENPEGLPFDGANILFDLAVDKQGYVYVAYYGNRRTLKVSPDGKVSVLLYAEGPWSPHGVDVFNGEVYVLESTIGVPKWWEFWKKDIIIPRVRKVSSGGQVSTVFEYQVE